MRLAPSCGDGDPEVAAQVAARRRVGPFQETLQAAAVEEFAAPLARPGPQVDDMIGAGHDLRVVLDDDDGVALVAQGFQDSEKPAAVAGVQAHGGLVEDEQGVDER